MGVEEDYKRYREVFDKIPLDELRRKLDNKKVLIKDDVALLHSRVGVMPEMARWAGKVLTIREIGTDSWDNDFKYFRVKEEGCSWEFNMIGGILQDYSYTPTEQNEDVELEIKKGDLVKFKQIEEEDKNNKVGEIFGIPVIKNVYEKEIEMPKKEFVVADIIGDIILPYYFSDKYNNCIITKDKLELVREGYVDKVKTKKRKLIKETKMLEDLEIMEEMKSKVNVKDFKKYMLEV